MSAQRHDSGLDHPLPISGHDQLSEQRKQTGAGNMTNCHNPSLDSKLLRTWSDSIWFKFLQLIHLTKSIKDCDKIESSFYHFKYCSDVTAIL